MKKILIQWFVSLNYFQIGSASLGHCESSESLFLVKGLILREVCRVTRELAILDQESCQHTEYSDIFPSKKERFVKTLWSPWPTTEQGNSSGALVNFKEEGEIVLVLGVSRFCC